MLLNHINKKYRKILFHLATMVVVISPLVVGELVVRLCIPAHAISLDDPYVSFSSIRPLFVPDPMDTRLETAKERLLCFCPQSFGVVKGSNTFRIFCLGGSTVQGRPYAVETSFTTWLKLNLEAARPKTDFEVVNCGGISYASYRLVPIMSEVLKYKPDLFIIYTGHNEFLEDRTYRRLKRIPRTLIEVHRAMLNLRSYSIANEFISKRRGRGTETGSSSKTVLPAEVDAKLDYKDGLETYHRDDEWRKGTIEHFRHNLQTMVRMSRTAGIPIILVNPVSNLKDSPPFKSEFSIGLSDNEKKRFTELWEQAGKLSWDDAYSKIQLLERADEIDSRHAGLLYLIGKCYEHIGRLDEAKKWFLNAKEEDVCPLRILEPMNEAILSVAAKNNVTLVDAKRLLESQSQEGIPGDEWLLDHVHPTIEGHQLIANSLSEAMEDMKLVHTPEGWRPKRDRLWKQHLSSLSGVYFEQGFTRLKRLHNWSRGPINDPTAASDSSED
jgi:lysophospholipase L1-like esterase